ncbi:MAG: hypothetical protein GY719_23150 [bacterium]|nr:hypothetical protein [bacterium]
MTEPKKNPHASALGKLGASKGGKARAASLTADKRSEIARRAAEKRWGKEVPQEIYPGSITVGDTEFPCAVLSDGTRVLTEANFMKGMGMYRSGALSKRRKADEGGARIPLYLAFKNIKPFVDKHLGEVHVKPLVYRTAKGGTAHGIEANLIPKICQMWLDARDAGVLGPRQELIAAKADILVRALSELGIIALVDEATGYQAVRARDALAKILEEFVAKELKEWVKTFPPEFYQEMFRLRDLPYAGDSIKRPQYIGHLTNDVVYKRLAPGVLKELKRLTPRDGTGRHKHQLHRRLTEDIGHPRLREHLKAVLALMKISDDWDEFIHYMDKALPRWTDTLRLPGI